jgi:hypothetical protein
LLLTGVVTVEIFGRAAFSGTARVVSVPTSGFSSAFDILARVWDKDDDN